MTKKFFYIATLSLLTLLPASAVDYRKLSDALVVALPVWAFGSALYRDDREGMRDWAAAMGANLLTTGALKYTIHATRPDGGAHSFPSGHTSVAFASAAFVHRRYGLRYAAPMYVLAALTGYSRVRAHRHYVRDVVAGAVIGAGFGYFLTQRIGGGVRVTPGTSQTALGLTVSKRW